MKSGFRPPLCTYRLNWARRTSWGSWDDWDDTVLQTQDSKFEPWRSEAEHTTSRSQRLPTILTLTRGSGRNIFCFFQTAETGNRTPNSGVKGSGANHYPRVPALLARGWRSNVSWHSADSSLVQAILARPILVKCLLYMYSIHKRLTQQQRLQPLSPQWVRVNNNEWFMSSRVSVVMIPHLNYKQKQEQSPICGQNHSRSITLTGKEKNVRYEKFSITKTALIYWKRQVTVTACLKSK